MPTSRPGPTASGSQGWPEAYVFFKHEDDGTAPTFALRLMELNERFSDRAKQTQAS